MRGKRNFHILKQPSVIIIPMIDIMLFLLVFFMISTIYMVQVNTMQITLPSVVNAKTETKSNIISVTIDKDGHVFYDMEKQPTIEIIGAVKKTIAEVENIQFISTAERLNIGNIINKKLLAASRIFQLLLDEDSSNAKCLALSDAEVVELVAKENSKITKAAVKDLKLPSDLTIGGLVRNGHGMVVTGNTWIQPNDHVVIFCLDTALHKIDKLFN